MKRRDFINWVGLGWIASSLPVAIAACSSVKNIGLEDWVSVGPSAELDKTGQLLAKESPVGPVLIVGTSKSGSLTAVSLTCTHAGCTVGWKTDTKKFVCPCHGSEYALDGTVKRGPAKEGLKTFAAKIEGDSVVVKLG
ncbi:MULTISPECIES: ubiquinol-cytochrome c reductase iron-sulfur subunit [Nostoc]|uniref:Ubiquinol-cytochrome c reductase iron-sulfur subunit n=1 Tax=Nostoc paludosum FACHB-159 TaxID=2692908 RepID=A0ABR8K168_9NOSO|nr:MULTISPECIES: ubiquinol-cytochrome c reductase iron-sulfur subunit [Nostoc]MBD2676147.1 ubiquinol-cytochrome c reductase iron-sulfur subunit [Nostoc sp. FACHB-857]MBD2732723.1 ubiquinol-cytochrome c reductase iron-sulfur subunit [Nostoc paludosum FACHB-159]